MHSEWKVETGGQLKDSMWNNKNSISFISR